MLISSHHPLVDKFTARTCLLLQDSSVWLQSECPSLFVILALLYSMKKFFAKNQLLAQTPSDSVSSAEAPAAYPHQNKIIEKIALSFSFSPASPQHKEDSAEERAK